MGAEGEWAINFSRGNRGGDPKNRDQAEHCQAACWDQRFHSHPPRMEFAPYLQFHHSTGMRKTCQSFFNATLCGAASAAYSPGLVQLTFVLQRDAQIVVQFGRVGRQFQRTAVAGDRFGNCCHEGYCDPTPIDLSAHLDYVQSIKSSFRKRLDDLNKEPCHVHAGFFRW